MRISPSQRSDTGALQVVQGGVSDAMLAELERLQQRPLADSTRRAYEGDWKQYCEWCALRQKAELPADPHTVALYLLEMASELDMVTLQRRLLVIRRHHEEEGLTSPTGSPLVKNVFANLRRERGEKPDAKAALLLEDLKLCLDSLPEGKLSSQRNRALLLIGWAGAFRRSELVGLTVQDLTRKKEGLLITLRRSKTDQVGKGLQKAIPYGQHEEDYCPVKALRAWLAAAKIEAGPLFRPIDRHGNVGAGALTGESVALIVQECVERIGLDPTLYGGHSLRAGVITSAVKNKADVWTIMRQSGHKSQEMVGRYVRQAELFEHNAATIAGL